MKHNGIKFILTSISGNILEWYDFALYGYFATVIAKLFFPTTNPYLSLMLTFGVFASGFIARPLGGVIFGHIGDKYGRRTALLISIILIMIPTVLIGVLPTYGSIGIASPILLIIFRLLQGVAVSGELTGSGTFLIECAPIEHRGFYGSLIMCSTYFGLLFGATVCLLVSSFFTVDQIDGFAWRIPFILSFFLGLIALLIRVNCDESPAFKKLCTDNLVLKLPVYTALKNFSIPIGLIFLTSSVLGVAIYLLIGYFPSYFISNKHMTLTQSTEISFIGLFALTIFVPIMGRLGDNIGHIKMLGLGSILLLVNAYNIFRLASDGRFITAILSVVLTALCLSPVSASIMPAISMIFPANVRYSSVSIGYNMSMTIFGGTTPLIAIYAVKNLESDLAPSIYLILCGLLTLGSLFFLKKYNAIALN